MGYMKLVVCVLILNNLYVGTRATCPLSDVQSIDNGRVNIIHDEESGDPTHAYFNCDDGYVLNGQYHLECNRELGTWGGHKPQCILPPPACPPLEVPPIDNGHVNIVYDLSGKPSVAFYACDNGYVLHGESQLTCNQQLGTWEGHKPLCILSPPGSEDDVYSSSGEISDNAATTPLFQPPTTTTTTTTTTEAPPPPTTTTTTTSTTTTPTPTTTTTTTSTSTETPTTAAGRVCVDKPYLCMLAWQSTLRNYGADEELACYSGIVRHVCCATCRDLGFLVQIEMDLEG